MIIDVAKDKKTQGPQPSTFHTYCLGFKAYYRIYDKIHYILLQHPSINKIHRRSIYWVVELGSVQLLLEHYTHI